MVEFTRARQKEESWGAGSIPGYGILRHENSNTHGRFHYLKRLVALQNVFPSVQELEPLRPYACQPTPCDTSLSTTAARANTPTHPLVVN